MSAFQTWQDYDENGLRPGWIVGRLGQAEYLVLERPGLSTTPKARALELVTRLNNGGTNASDK